MSKHKYGLFFLLINKVYEKTMKVGIMIYKCIQLWIDRYIED